MERKTYAADIIWILKSCRLRWAGQVVKLGEEITYFMVLMHIPNIRIIVGRPRRR